MKTQRSELTVRQKFLAMRRAAPSIAIVESADGWRVDLSRVKLKHDIPPSSCEGKDTDKAINETWFWLTGEDYDRGQIHCPAPIPLGPIFAPLEPNCIICEWGEFEVWMRWEGFMWFPRVIQRRASAGESADKP